MIAIEPDAKVLAENPYSNVQQMLKLGQRVADWEEFRNIAFFHHVILVKKIDTDGLRMQE